MNKILLKILGICIITSLLIPTTIGLKCDSDDMDNIDPYIIIMLDRINDDGHLIFRVDTCCSEEINNATIFIHIYGSGPFTNLNKVDINTEIFIQNLPSGESEFLKTKDQVFKVRPLLRKPLIFFFYGKIDIVFNEHLETTSFKKILSYIYGDLFYGVHLAPLVIIPYP